MAFDHAEIIVRDCWEVWKELERCTLKKSSK